MPHQFEYVPQFVLPWPPPWVVPCCGELTRLEIDLRMKHLREEREREGERERERMRVSSETTGWRELL
jgi:hypothetical protein